MPAWRVAKCLDQLLRQINAEAPHRSINSDGSIGNDAHQKRDSDHNPWVGPVGGLWIVTARDFTHDPQNGFDAYRFADVLKANKDPRIKYVISRGRIWSLARDREGWRPYNGPNAHTHHTHVSCSFDPALFDRVNAWNLTAPLATTPKEDDMPTADEFLDAHIVAKNPQTGKTEDLGSLRGVLWTLFKRTSDDDTRLDALAKKIDDIRADVRDYALWQVLYELETEDERDQAQKAYDDAIAAGKTTTEAKAAAVKVLQSLVDGVKKSQAAKKA